MSRELRFLEKLETIIPGFRGYKRKELLREDDRLVREKVASILEDSKRSLERIMPAATGNFEVMELMDKTRKKLMMVISMVKHAPHGYSGYYDRVKIREEELKKILEYDYNLIKDASEIMNLMEELRGSMSDTDLLKRKLTSITERLERIDSLIRERDRLFKVAE